MIEARGLTKRFGATVAVDDLSFEVQPGVVTGFLGPNGSGKSTTMRLLLGLDHADAGTGTFGGRPYRSLTNPLREVGGLLDASYAHPGRSARNHLRWLATVARLPTARVDEVLGMVGLAEVADRKVGGYSLGMRQRLGLAGALLGDPATLLLDEPANGLDPEGIRWIRTFLERLAAQGRTVFVSSHLLAEMSLMADSLIVIGRGRLIHSGDVAGFVGRFTPSSVRVQSPGAAALAQALRAAGAVVDEHGSTLHVTGLDAPAVGAIARRDGVELHELTTVTASLEDAFIEVTRGDQEFRGASP
ncbi:MAG: ATP-binding cassette domain-containing protein [Acidimicrobiales bacterium]|nr:ATP-binding cassette domain-containing protein [Acidimicrobiales bacterium]